MRVIRNADLTRSGSRKGFAERYFSEKESVASALECGDIAMSTSGEVGKIWQVNEEGFFASNFVRLLRPDVTKVTPGFLRLAMGTHDVQQALQANTAGMTISNLQKTFYSSAAFPLPPLPEQQRISVILDEAFDGIAHARANAEGNSCNARELFRSRLQAEFDLLGRDHDWMTLEQLLDTRWIQGHLDGNHGSDYPRKEEFVSSGVPYISANCLEGDEVDMSRCKYLTPARASKLRKGIARNRDVLFAHNATVGPVAILDTTEPKVILGTSLTYYRCDESKILPEYLALFMRSAGFIRQYEQVMGQSTRNQVPITKQREFRHLIPPVEVQRKMIDRLGSLSRLAKESADLNQRKLAALNELKSSLLRQAFSGQL